MQKSVPRITAKSVTRITAKRVLLITTNDRCAASGIKFCLNRFGVGAPLIAPASLDDHRAMAISQDLIELTLRASLMTCTPTLGRENGHSRQRRRPDRQA